MDWIEEAALKPLVVIVCDRVVDPSIDCLRSLTSEIDRVPGCRVAACENGTGRDAEERLGLAIAENGGGSWVKAPNLLEEPRAPPHRPAHAGIESQISSPGSQSPKNR